MENMVEIVLLSQSQYGEVVSLYRQVNYGGTVAPEDLIVGAYVDGCLVGVVRLVSENGLLVLRGLHVRKKHQRQGIGFDMLTELCRHFGERECWCIPHMYLRDFYSRVGFLESPVEGAPAFLAERLGVYAESGLKVVLMKRLFECSL